MTDAFFVVSVEASHIAWAITEDFSMSEQLFGMATQVAYIVETSEW